MTFGILQRYVIGEVLRAFVMALLSMTAIFVLFMVMGEAAKIGLSPQDMLTLIPYVVPSTLPYTVPVSMLFSVTVVYGRLASDNEVIAVKTAGLSAWTILTPTILIGAALSAGLLFLSAGVIPRATHQAKLVIFKNFEDMFYKVLKYEGEMSNPDWPFMIKVSDVDLETRWLKNATFKHRAKKGAAPHTFDATVQAKRAKIKFDLDAGKAYVYLDEATVTGGSKEKDIFLINDREIEIDLPGSNNRGYEKRIQEWTSVELGAEQVKYRLLMAKERKRNAVKAAFWIASGRIDRIEWKGIQRAFVDYSFWESKINIFETEKQLRVAQSFGSLIFVILGAPVGILFARRDFLSAFISCFLPIILVYYPLMLLGVNLGKEGVVHPVLALWGGNLLLGVLAGFVLPPVIRH